MVQIRERFPDLLLWYCYLDQCCFLWHPSPHSQPVRRNDNIKQHSGSYVVNIRGAYPPLNQPILFFTFTQILSMALTRMLQTSLRGALEKGNPAGDGEAFCCSSCHCGTPDWISHLASHNVLGEYVTGTEINSSFKFSGFSLSLSLSPPASLSPASLSHLLSPRKDTLTY